MLRCSSRMYGPLSRPSRGDMDRLREMRARKFTTCSRPAGQTAAPWTAVCSAYRNVQGDNADVVTGCQTLQRARW